MVSSDRCTPLLPPAIFIKLHLVGGENNKPRPIDPALCSNHAHTNLAHFDDHVTASCFNSKSVSVSSSSLSQKLEIYQRKRKEEGLKKLFFISSKSMNLFKVILAMGTLLLVSRPTSTAVTALVQYGQSKSCQRAP